MSEARCTAGNPLFRVWRILNRKALRRILQSQQLLVLGALAILTGNLPASEPPGRQAESGILSSDARSITPLAKNRFRLITEDPVPEEFFFGPLPRSSEVIADAGLNDVCRVGSICWAVGDRGVVLRSSDLGSTWISRLVPFECSLQSVCFVTDRIGWIAGIRGSENRISETSAVLLHTRDGGESWMDLSQTSDPDSDDEATVTSGEVGAGELTTRLLPGIRDIAFFSLEKAYAVTLPCSARNGATLFRSTNGGVSWDVIRSDHREAEFTVAAFRNEDEGILGGEGLTHGALVSDVAVTSSPPARTPRQVRGLSIDGDGNAWMVGDGAFAMMSTSSGVSWMPAEFNLSDRIPGRADRLLDFHTVAHHGSTVLIAGSPGSVLLRSEDSGQNWTLISTGVSSEIHQMMFLNENTIIAAGALGAILRSDDAGVTWTSVRAGSYRAALMNLASDFQSVSEEALTTLCADRGIRSVTIQMSPVSGGSGGQNGASSNSNRNFVDHRRDLSQIGVSTSSSEWLFFRSRPDHHRHLESLESDWDSQTDGQAKQLLTMRLARLIRIWKPTVILVDRCDSSDAVFQLTLQSLPLAVRIAGVSDSLVDVSASETGKQSSLLEAQADNEWCHTLSRQFAALNLPPWSVQRIAVRCAPDRTSSLVWSDNDLLPGLRTTSGLLLRCLRSSQDLSTAISGTELTSVISPRRGHNVSRPDQRKYYEILSDASISVTPPDLFQDLPLRPGSDGRRRTRASAPEQIAAMRQVVRSAQIESAAFEGHIESATVTDAMIAELTTIGSDLPPALARKQLQDLAALHLRSEAIDSYLATLKELIRRYPSSQEALASAESLFLYYSSREVRRIRMKQISDGNRDVNPAGKEVEIPGIAGTPALRTQPVIQPVSGTLPLFRSSPGDQSASLQAQWDHQASTALNILRPMSSEGISSPVLMRLAANARIAGRNGEHAAVLADLAGRGLPWAARASAESQSEAGATALTLRLFRAERTPVSPLLDAVLNDACWENAEEVSLTPDQKEDQSRGSLIMITWDSEFLYVAGRFRHPDSGPKPALMAVDRDHDELKDGVDRVELELDVDRDYATAYVFEIGQNGMTRERCWTLTGWNPQWYLASASDRDLWRFEAAIPLSELSMADVVAGELWNVRVQRVVPGYFWESPSSGTRMQSENKSSVSSAKEAQPPQNANDIYGHLRFIRNQSRPAGQMPKNRQPGKK